MLSQKNKIKDKDLISLIFNKGEFKKTRLFNLYILKLSPPRQFLVVVSKKLQRRAIKRNLIKRRVYNTINNNIDSFKKNVKVILIAKEGLLNETAQSIKKDLKDLFIDDKS